MEQNSNKGKHPLGAAGGCRRHCLSCGHPFSAGGRFLRICLNCKESEEWQSGNCDFALHEAANDNSPGI